MALRFGASCADGLCPGWSVILKGQCSSASNKFAINFLCDQDDRVAFHFNPRFTESEVVCNSYIGKKWGEEEKCTGFPFVTDRPFQVEIYSDDGHFHVYLDDTKIMQYKHRVMDLKNITKVQVVNDISISSVEISKKYFY